MSTEPGWYHDPYNPQQLRWWDGQQWTGNTQLSTPSQNKPSSAKIIFTIVGLVLVIPIVFLFLLFSGFATTINSDSRDIRTMEKLLIPENGNMFLQITTCENLCEKYSVRVKVPKDETLYSTDDISHIVTNIPAALKAIKSKEDRVQLCFEVHDDNYTINFSDNDFTPEEQTLTTRLSEAGIPKSDKYGADASGGYSFGNNCMIIMVEDIK